MFKKKQKEEVVVVLTINQFERLKEQCRANTLYNNDPCQLAYNMGMLRVLELLRDGFVDERSK